MTPNALSPLEGLGGWRIVNLLEYTCSETSPATGYYLVVLHPSFGAGASPLHKKGSTGVGGGGEGGGGL
jgi:hypothetical protein